MRLLTGTSGYSYKAWKGPFYPEKAPDADLLRLYSEQLGAVEINNTFYRMPRPSVMESWAETVPERFVFVIKASQRITHRARLQNAGDSVQYLWKCVAGLGAHLGPILFQLPPNLRADLPRLRDFLAELPAGLRAVFEFRHPSWVDDAVHEALRSAGAALCTADHPGAADLDVIPTADFGYFRLRREDYDDASTARWVERIAAQPWREVFVFFKHEDGGAAPRMALRFAELFAAR